MTQDQGSVSGTETIFDQFGIESHSESVVIGRDTSQPLTAPSQVQFITILA